jgi:hypothetical protein
MGGEVVSVACYSGARYAERPTSFDWRGAGYSVKRVESEWLEPGERHFRVRTEDDRLFELCYDERADLWLIEEEAARSPKGGRDEQGGP